MLEVCAVFFSGVVFGAIIGHSFLTVGALKDLKSQFLRQRLEYMNEWEELVEKLKGE